MGVVLRMARSFVPRAGTSKKPSATFNSCLCFAFVLPPLFFALGPVGCGGDAAREAGTPPEHLSIFYSCDTRGHIEPCACATGQAGGIARRMTFLKEQRDGSALLVDAGNVTAGPRDWERFEMEYILKGYDAMGYNAINMGHREASLDIEHLRQLAGQNGALVSASLLDDDGNPVFPPYRIVDFPKGYRVGILGVLSEPPDMQDIGKGVTIAPLEDAVARHLSALKKETDFIVLLAFADEERMKALAERFFEIDVIIGGDVIQPTQTPMEANQSIIVALTDIGKAMGRLDVTFDPSGAPSYANRIHMLDDKVASDPDVMAIVDQFKLAMAGTGFQPHRDDEEGLTTITAARSKDANTYGAAENCKPCHGDAYKAWFNSHHSMAFASLVEKNYQNNPRCLQCHTVGYGASDGYLSEQLTLDLAMVSCGNCHGRGDYHVRFHSGEDIPERAAKFKGVDCIECHDEENSPKFDRAEYWERIKHGRD